MRKRSKAETEVEKGANRIFQANEVIVGTGRYYTHTAQANLNFAPLFIAKPLDNKSPFHRSIYSNLDNENNDKFIPFMLYVSYTLYTSSYLMLYVCAFVFCAVPATAFR